MPAEAQHLRDLDEVLMPVMADPISGVARLELRAGAANDPASPILNIALPD